MWKIGRNEPCPCGSGKKFKNCHIGKEEELHMLETEAMKTAVAVKITSLPEVDYGRAKEMAADIDIKGLTGVSDFTGIKFIDFDKYVAMESFDKGNLKDEHHRCAGLIVNPMKTEDADKKNLYIAITPNIHDSSLIHELAHVLDLLGGSGFLPGSAFQLGLQTNTPMDHLDHPKEYGDWLLRLKEMFDVELDAEDAIIAFLHENGMLMDSSLIKEKKIKEMVDHSKSMIAFLMNHKEDINELIKGRIGYMG